MKPWMLFKLPSEDPRGDTFTKTTDKTTTEKEKKSILCKYCRNEVTSAEHTIIINGNHSHTFTNPAGITFTIGCFSEAWGCIAYGIPTYEHTWFPGYSWSIALCARCYVHLGWYYQSGRNFFFGLILNNLIRESYTH